MKASTLALASALVGGGIALTAATSVNAGPAEQPGYKFEKCFGVAKAGKNDCQTATSSCAGTSKRDAQTDAWIYVPTGTCDRLVGGSTQTKAS